MTLTLPTAIASKAWVVATAVAAVLALGLTVMLFSSYLQNRDLTTQRAALQRSINDPETGYIAQLAQARTNVATLKAVVDHQNEAYDKLSVESRAALVSTRARLAEAQAETAALEKKLAGFLATKPSGATLDERVRDIDARAMKEFLP